ncbi:hypothetical protein BC834DRAFT_284007 [Gloeopeniophorella convolvens]|nr:hypothetical protein BC834DRAFT_284007 [Gloeopeniophorella convolvens]
MSAHGPSRCGAGRSGCAGHLTGFCVRRPMAAHASCRRRLLYGKSILCGGTQI